MAGIILTESAGPVRVYPDFGILQWSRATVLHDFIISIPLWYD